MPVYDAVRMIIMPAAALCGLLSLIVGAAYPLLGHARRIGRLGMWHIGLMGIGNSVLAFGIVYATWRSIGRESPLVLLFAIAAGYLLKITGMVLICIHIRNLESER